MVQAAAESETTSTPAEVLYRGPDGALATVGLIETAPAAVALLFALGVVAIGLALAAAESADERNLLIALGAPPRTLRRTNGAQALLLTLLGALVAVPIALGPLAVLCRLGGDDLPFVVPWRTIALVVVAVPLAAAGLSAVATRDRRWQVSTATFD
jgi:putative ABC transport system permease protein